MVSGWYRRCHNHFSEFMNAIRIILIVPVVVTLTGCAGNPMPATVENLDTQVEEVSFIERFGENYVVKQGDTLFAIAWYSGNDYRDIARWNQLSDPYQLQIGQRLRLTPPARRATSRSEQYKKRQPSTRAVVSAAKRPRVADTEVITRAPTKSQQGEAKPTKGQTSKITAKASKSDPSTYETAASQNLKQQRFKPRWLWPTQGDVDILTIGPERNTRGITIAGNYGQPIYAAATGKVVYVGNALKGYGNLAIIKHQDGYLSAYGFNRDILVREQQVVSQGQHIANMGRTTDGREITQFEIRQRGKALNPLEFLPQK